MLRHGQSTWSLANLFTGWHDLPLTALSVEETRAAGRTMAADGFTFDLAHTSVLARAVVTCNLTLDEMGQVGCRCNATGG